MGFGGGVTRIEPFEHHVGQEHKQDRARGADHNSSFSSRMRSAPAYRSGGLRQRRPQGGI
jgi:hypothetical protein